MLKPKCVKLPIFAFLLIVLCSGCKNFSLLSQPLSFPFEIKLDEVPHGELGLKIREIKIVLSKKHYNEENLKTLFHYISRRYQDYSEVLRVEVYTDSAKLAQNDAPSKIIAHSSQVEAVPYDAMLWRQGNSIASNGADCEYFSYKPDLNSSEVRIVIVRGTMRFRKKNIKDAYEASNTNIKIRILSYEMEGVSPKGFYYTFECDSKGLNDWQGFLTFRQDNYISPPQNQIHIVNDKIAYVYMGWLYAITVNGGETWEYWNAEDDLPSWKCCDSKLIQNVQVIADGSGTMTLNSQASKPSNLYTKDYGKSWNPTQ